ncbi:MAG: LLM class F420-dependent oxidoreductase [Chloroflexi bacterium]|nr:LLM class F420-dependent oxidoreductase [Chloroflexota bacterium]
MQIGVSLPITEFGGDLVGVRDYVQAAEDLGYSHIRTLDHVLGADPQRHPEVPRFAYTHESYIHEPLTLLSYLAGMTKKLGLVTGILILPQRQTVLVAKQAAEVDVLSGGRLRMGIGVGWNPVEYEALGEDFHTRGQRVEEQIAVLRALWTQEVVDFQGRWHKISHAGLNPPPVQRPIPVWMGAGSSASRVPSDRVLRRIGRLADGWFPMLAPDETGRDTIAKVHGYAKAAGRDPESIGLEGRITVAGQGPEDWVGEIKAWTEMGATHLCVNTGGAGYSSPDEHIDAIRRVREVTGA